MMMMKKKVLIPLLVLVIAAVGSYAFVFARPARRGRDRVDGTVVVLPRDFLLNLSDGRYVKLDVALVLAPGQAATVAGATPSSTSADSGYAGLPEEAAIRDIVTNVVTAQSGATLISAKGRERIKARILQQVLAHTDVRVNDVLLPDVAVQ